MKSLLTLSSLLLATALFSCQFEPQEPPVAYRTVEAVSGPEADVAAIQQTAGRLLNAVKEQDLDALMDGFTEDAVLIAPGQPILKGKAAIRVHYRDQFEHFELTDIGPSLDELVVCGEWAFSRGTVAVLGYWGEHGEPLRVFNRGMEIWKKQPDGSWKVARAVGNRGK